MYKKLTRKPVAQGLVAASVLRISYIRLPSRHWCTLFFIKALSKIKREIEATHGGKDAKNKEIQRFFMKKAIAISNRDKPGIGNQENINCADI